MKSEDVKIGMRVIVHSKRGGLEDLQDSLIYRRSMMKNQKYLYVVAIETYRYSINKEIVFLLNDTIQYDGDYYIAEDFELDMMSIRKDKLKELYGTTI